MTHKTDGDGASRQSKRISISAARKMLGMVGRNYSDDDLDALLDHLYGIAGSAFERYLDLADPTDETKAIEPADLNE